MDTCEGETAPIAQEAGRASAALIGALNLLRRGEEPDVIERFLDRWVTYLDPASPECRGQGSYCGSKWAAFAQQEPTGPYLEEALSCRSGARPTSTTLTLILYSLIFVARRGRRWHHARSSSLLISLFVLLLFAPCAVRAESFAQSEFHGSTLSDAPGRSVMARTLGYGLRAGYQWGAWRAIAQLERSYWWSIELDDRLKPGSLNLGLGGAYLSAGGFVRSSFVIGPSILRFDTAFHDKGTTGFFVDLRPVELSWEPLDWLAITLTPLSFAYLSPVTETPAIRMVLYRTLIGTELRL